MGEVSKGMCFHLVSHRGSYNPHSPNHKLLPKKSKSRHDLSKPHRNLRRHMQCSCKRSLRGG